ncbi:MAG: hypothetical protein ACQEXM_26970 [Actinomycetota bacterium]
MARQREGFATNYGRASSPVERLTAVVTALRAVLPRAETGRKPGDAIDSHLERITDALAALLDELHSAQEHAATSTIRNDERRIARNQRRRNGTGTEPDRPHTGRERTAGGPA